MDIRVIALKFPLAQNRFEFFICKFWSHHARAAGLDVPVTAVKNRHVSQETKQWLARNGSTKALMC